MGTSGRRRIEGEGVRKVNMVEYYALMNENGKMRPAEAIPGMDGGTKENDGGVNSTMIYFKNFCRCRNGQQCDHKKKDKDKKAVT
jgi:hypothetical protein